MELEGIVGVVTGGASGIGRALARRLSQEGATVAVADLDGPGVRAVAGEIGGLGIEADVSDEAAVAALIERVERDLGPLELWCGNAGIGGPVGGVELSDEVWDRLWSVNVMAHVIAGRHLLPRWLERGSGHLLVTASAAGLLTNLGNAPYAATKHAAVALAEWLAIAYGDRGVRVSCLCPQGVRTPMTEADGDLATEQVRALGLIEPEEVAEAVVEGLRADRFLILPHPEVAGYEQRRAGDRERWLAGMRRMQRDLGIEPPGP